MINCRIVDNQEYGLHLTGECDPTFGSSLAQWNDIHDNGSGQPDRDLLNGTLSISAPYIYWGTTSLPAIQNLIHHLPDDDALGLVYFSPWTNDSHDTEFEGGSSPVPDPDPGLSPIPTAFDFPPNHPNPFNPATVIRYDLPRECRVCLEVFDLSGRLVKLFWMRFRGRGTKL